MAVQADWRALFRRSRDLARKSGAGSAAEDVAQRAVIGIWRKMRDGVEIENIDGLLSVMVLREACQAHRTAHARFEVTSLAGVRACEPARQERLMLEREAEQSREKALDAAMLRILPTRSQVIARLLEGASQAEVAQKLGISARAVACLKSRGVADLAALVQEQL